MKTPMRKRSINILRRDIENLEIIARWWCVTPDHLARARMTEAEIKELWEQDTPDSEHTRKLLRLSHSRRMKILSSLTKPLFTVGYAERFGHTYWLTKAGATLIGAPFRKYLSGNMGRAPHAWAAADIGMRLERENYKVFSEREFACGETVTREIIWEENPTTLRPDMVIPCADGRFIFIEVERKISGAKDYYEKKLNAYLANPAIASVWYITDKKVVAQRVHGVYQRVKPNHPPKPFKVLPMLTHPNGYTQFTGWDKNTESLTHQLTELGAVKKEGENSHG